MDLTGSVYYQGIIHLNMLKVYVIFSNVPSRLSQLMAIHIHVILNKWCSPGRLASHRISSLLHQLIKLEIINIPKKPCWMIFNMIPLPMHPAIASHRNKKGPGSRFEMRSEYSAVTKTSLFVAKITFMVAEMIFKVSVMTYSMVKFTSAVTEITFSGTDIRLLVAKITFLVAEMIFKVTVMTYSMVKFTSAVTEITFSGTDIRLLVAKITCVAAEKLLK